MRLKNRIVYLRGIKEIQKSINKKEQMRRFKTEVFRKKAKKVFKNAVKTTTTTTTTTTTPLTLSVL
jgi:hypothetical protein